MITDDNELEGRRVKADGIATERLVNITDEFGFIRALMALPIWCPPIVQHTRLCYSRRVSDGYRG